MVYEIRTWTSGPGDGSFGLHLIVRRDDGTFDLYAHLSTVLVNVGERVYEGEPIALSGDTGKNGPGTYADHLHVQNSSHSGFPRDLSVTFNPFTEEDLVTQKQYEELMATVAEHGKRLAVLTEAVSNLNAGLVQYDPNGPYDTIASVRDLNNRVKEMQAEVAAHITGHGSITVSGGQA